VHEMAAWRPMWRRGTIEPRQVPQKLFNSRSSQPGVFTKLPDPSIRHEKVRQCARFHAPEFASPALWLGDVMLMRRTPRALAVVAALAAGACQVAKSSNPLTPTVAGPIPGVTITAPRIMQPSTGSRISAEQQPIALTVGNASTSGVRPLSYGFDVAADAGFTNKVFTRDGIVPGDGGQTTLRLPDALASGRSYFWRARAQDGANTGPYTAAADFNVFTPVVINAPVLISPVNDVTINSLRPRFSFSNASRSGPAGAITYAVQVSDTPSFSSVAVWTVAEQAGQTNLDAPIDLPAGTQFFWRVLASDPTTRGPFSATASFRTPVPVVTPPPTGPGPADAINVGQVTFLNNPPDLGSWARTAKITFIQFRSDALIVDFDRRTGAGRWPNRPFNPGDPPGAGGIQYTLGMCFNISAQWYCSAAIQFWQDRPLEAAAAPSSIPQTWYYDARRWGPMTGYLPAQGEMVGIFVVAGNVRNISSSSLLLAKERSSIVLVPFDRGNGTVFTFSAGSLPLSFRR
jgi:hypothetical protein